MKVEGWDVLDTWWERRQQGCDDAATRGKPCWKTKAGQTSDMVARWCGEWMTLDIERSEGGGWEFLWGGNGCNCKRLRSCTDHRAKEWVRKLFRQVYPMTGTESVKMWHRTLHVILYLLTTIGLSPGGSSTVHIYTQKINGTTQITTEKQK
jgi:hypothetical protein